MGANVVNNANSNNNNNNNNNNDNNDNVNNFNIANNNNAGNNVNDIQICPFPCIPGPPPVIVGQLWFVKNSSSNCNCNFPMNKSDQNISGRKRRSEKATLVGRLTNAAMKTQSPVRDTTFLCSMFHVYIIFESKR